MATVAEMFVNIGANTNGFEREINQMQRQFERMATRMQRGTRSINREFENLTPQAQATFTRMRTDMDASRESMRDFQRQQLEVQAAFYDLTSAAGEFSGSNEEYIEALTDLGNRQRQITEQMQANNTFAVNSFHRMVGSMMARSTQSSSIASNFDRINNPLYRVNNGLLRVSGGMEMIARRGQPAALALSMLGPTANMRQLQSQVRLINAGLMRFQMVAMAAAVASGILYTALFKAAKGPDPGEVYAKQDELLANYAQAVRDRTQEIMEAWNLFENIQLSNVTGKQLTKYLSDQVGTLKTWRMNLGEIAKSAGEEFAQYLADMGPQAANEVAHISEMSKPELDKYVALWREKMALSKAQALSELEGLKKETERKVKELQKTLTPLGLALEPLKQAWAGAFKPMVEAFTLVSVPIVNFLTKIGEMITKFNEAHPKIALVVQAILMLIPALFLILSPLAIGIGLWHGMQAAFASVWVFIGPLVTGFASMAGTVLIVAAAIVLLVAGIVHLWKTSETFRNIVIAGWESIKAAAISIWNFIYNSILVPIINAIVTFVQSQLERIKAFWDENGQMIMEAAQNVWSVISKVIEGAMEVIMAIMEVVWPIVKAIVVGVWNAIKQVISGAIEVILGIIKFFSALFTGNWDKMWQAVGQILWGAINTILGWLQLTFFGGIGKGITAVGTAMKTGFTTAWNTVKTVFSSGISGALNIVTTGLGKVVSFITGLGKTFFNAGKGLIDMMAKGISNAASAVLNTVKSLAQKVRNMLPFSPAKDGPLSDLDKLDFGGPISDSIKWGMPGVQSLMGKMLTMPDINANTSMAMSGGGAAAAAPINITLNYSGNASKNDVMSMMDIIENELANRINTNLRVGGVKNGY